MNGRPAIESLTLALSRHFGPLRQISSDSVAWHSATYSGQRHKIGFTVDNSACLSTRLDSLDDLDIPLRRGFVASIAVVERSISDAGVVVQIEALTLDA